MPQGAVLGAAFRLAGEALDSWPCSFILYGELLPIMQGDQARLAIGRVVEECPLIP
jgi:hypothetical protein